MAILKMHLKGSTLTMLIMHFCCEHSSQSTFGTVKEVLKIKYFTSERHVRYTYREKPKIVCAEKDHCP